MFTESASRRAAVALRVDEAAGVVEGGPRAAMNIVGFGVEIVELLDLEATATAFDPRSPLLPAGLRETRSTVPSLTAGVGGRLAFDVPLDLRHRVFLLLGTEVGAVQREGGYWLLEYGIDVALSRSLRLGLRPVNLSYGPYGRFGAGSFAVLTAID